MSFSACRRYIHGIMKTLKNLGGPVDIVDVLSVLEDPFVQHHSFIPTLPVQCNDLHTLPPENGRVEVGRGHTSTLGVSTHHVFLYVVSASPWTCKGGKNQKDETYLVVLKELTREMLVDFHEAALRQREDVGRVLSLCTVCLLGESQVGRV